MAQKTNLKEFEAVFPKLEAVLLEQAASFKLPQAFLEWYQRVSLPLRLPLLFFHSPSPVPLTPPCLDDGT